MQAHEGAIVVNSQVGNGTTFTLYLPAAAPRAGAPELEEGTKVTAGPGERAGGGKRVLYIDDDDSLVLIIERMLKRRGMRVSGFIEPREALSALRANPSGFDVVVSDYNMPGMSGLAVAREVRAIRPDLPVALISGFIDDALQAQAEGAGVRELIFKANVVEDLCAAVVRLVENVGEESKPS